MTKVRVLLIAAMSMALGFLLGITALQTVTAPTAVKPAYLTASSRPIHPDKMAPYRAAAWQLNFIVAIEGR
jgi:hypothetical protein